VNTGDSMSDHGLTCLFEMTFQMECFKTPSLAPRKVVVKWGISSNAVVVGEMQPAAPSWPMQLQLEECLSDHMCSCRNFLIFS
jgi:hypothetical protein